MIRVIYRWRVDPADFEQFESIWRVTTNRIHESVPGALGSFMLRSCTDESEVLTVAKWDSMQAWQAFWGDTNPSEMQDMRKLGRRVSVDAYYEIEDYTR